MKKSYIKILLFIFTLGFILILNSLKFKMLGQVGLSIFLLLSLVIIYFIFGFEKDRHRYSRDIILEIIIILMAFFLFYYLSGILIGFAKNANYLTVRSLCTIIIPIVFYIIIKEFMRYQLMMKASESKILLFMVCLLFIIIDNVIPFSSHLLGFNRDTFLLIALSLLPSISENILCSYLGYYFGYKPCIIYLLVMYMYRYLLPIIPNPNEYLYSIIFLVFPLLVLIRVRNWLKRDRTMEVAYYNYRMRKREVLLFIPLIMFSCSLIYVVSGYFRYYAIAVMSGSMEPNISKGDVVIVDKDFDDVRVGDVLAYRYESKMIVHRIYRVINNDNEYFIYTKGDFNGDYDKYKVTEDMFVGIVKFSIPLVGYPTVLLNERW